MSYRIRGQEHIAQVRDGQLILADGGVALEEALGVKVDVGTPGSLRESLRDAVLAEAVPL